MTLNRFIRLLLLTVGIALPAAVTATTEEDLTLSDVSSCVVEPNTVVEISSRIDGILEAVEVERGDAVTAGGVVAKLEAGVERAAVAHARARAAMEAEIRSNEASLEYGERMLGRVTELKARQVVSAEEIDRVRSEAKIARHRLEQAREQKRLAELELARTRAQLRRHTIVSPIDGVVAERYLNPGESVEEKPILRIAQINPLRVEMIVPAEQHGLVKRGDKAIVRLDDAFASEHEAEVIIVDPIIDAASGTFRVTLRLPNDEHNLTSGLRCAVSFVEPDEQAVAATVE